MRRLLLSIYLALHTMPAIAQEAPAARPEPSPITILSIVPAQGEPGRSVSLYGNGFSEGTRVYLGNADITPDLPNETQLTFTVPDLQPGLYALYLRRTDGTNSRVYSFTVIPPRPSISELSPDHVVACAIGANRDVTISGNNFAPGARVLFDGAVIRSNRTSSTEIVFSAPAVPGGLHQVQVKNGDDTASDIQALMVDAKPEITSVTRGEERVSSYDLIINGINFYQGSSVMVDGKRVIGGTIDWERTSYVDCTKIVYQRHPFDQTPKTFRIQIINPSGDESSAVQVSAP